ncbi:MAG: MBL fold metallo-hydrolase [Ruminococcus sp.]|jgi:competence protein ComEC|nr:MBL fold metallo-hydrolase [Ruminococcus sp.]
MAGQSRKPKRRGTKAPQSKLSGKLSLPLIIILLFLAVGLVLSAYYEYSDKPFLEESETVEIAEDELTVYFLDVEQGDSEIITIGGMAMLIDAGEAEYGETVVSYLHNLGITKLDYIIATHPHSDHIGGLSTVIENFDVDKILMPVMPEEMTPTTKVFEKLLDTIDDKGLKITAVGSGDSFKLGKAEFTVVSPEKNADFSDLNDYSTVIRLVYKNSRWLFTGDAEKPAEEIMLESGENLQADILKVAHHGSENSSTEKFLAAVRPRWAVIEVGAGNSYNHPTEETLTRLEEHAERIFRTDIDGTIILRTDGNAIVRVNNISTERQE